MKKKFCILKCILLEWIAPCWYSLQMKINDVHVCCSSLPTNTPNSLATDNYNLEHLQNSYISFPQICSVSNCISLIVSTHLQTKCSVYFVFISDPYLYRKNKYYSQSFFSSKDIPVCNADSSGQILPIRCMLNAIHSSFISSAIIYDSLNSLIGCFRSWLEVESVRTAASLVTSNVMHLEPKIIYGSV